MKIKMKPNNKQPNKKPIISPIDSSLKKAIVDGVTTYSNLNQRILKLSEDKIKICLIKNISKIEKRKNWQNPFTLLISIILTLTTTNFKNWLLPKESWMAVFFICGMASFIWLIISLFEIKKKITIDQIIDELAGTDRNE